MDEITTRPTPRCFYCGATESLQEDHVVPFSRGGTSLPRNLVLACQTCNREKSDRLPSEWKPEPILPERVYLLERDLVEWHEEVDARRRARAMSLLVGWLVAVGEDVGVIEALDSRGVRIRCFWFGPKAGSDNPDAKPIAQLAQDYYAWRGYRQVWKAWSEMKGVCVADPDSPRETEDFARAAYEVTRPRSAPSFRVKR